MLLFIFFFSSETRSKSFVTVIFDDRICIGKIFSLHWLTDIRFITCCADGKLEVFNLNSSKIFSA